jgi:uncharacterized protein (TIGR02118 family)
MVQLTVMYPNKPGSRFDMDYYLAKHMALVRERWTPLGMSQGTVVRGVAGGAPGAPAPYQVVASITFTSQDALNQALKAHGKEIMKDVPNFTDVAPEVQVSEIVA